jgi:hypothetical protein
VPRSRTDADKRLVALCYPLASWHGTAHHDGATRSCVLCGGRGKLTREDVLPNWVRSYAAQYAEERAPGGSFAGTAYGKERADQPLPPPIVARMVCQTCNGWMNGTFETTARPHLIALMERTATQLAEESVSAVARWINKTALVYALTVKPRVFSAATYRRFRHTGAPIDNCRIFVGEKDDAGAMYSTRPPPTPAPIEAGTGGDFRIATWKTTLTLGPLVTHYTWVAPGVSARTVADRDGLVVPIWPAPSGGIAWPPPQKLSEANAAQLGEWIVDSE